MERKNDFAFEHYRADIDGLRAIAVLLVVIFHYFHGALSGGYVGVDVFFVISGFVIARNTLLTGRMNFSALEFFKKRIIRLFPALLLVLCFTFLLGLVLMLPDEFWFLSNTMRGAAFFLANWQQARHGGYFDPAIREQPLLHLWSLGVEEQFYLLWPLAALLLFAGGRRLAVGGLLLVLALSLAWSAHMVREAPKIAFFWPQGRIWELGAGVLLALGLHHWPAHLMLRRAGNAVMGLGLALVLGSAVWLDETAAFPGLLALPVVVGTVLMIWAGPHAEFGRSVLAWPGLVTLGRLSYAWYLWHWPVLVFARLSQAAPLSIGARLALLLGSLLLAWATHRWIEQPAKRLSSWALAVGLVLGMGTLGVLGHWTYRQSIAWPTLLSQQVSPAIQAAYGDWSFPNGFETLKFYGKSYPVVKADQPIAMVMVGDSHAQQYGPALLQDYKNGIAPNTLFMTAGGCPVGSEIQGNISPPCKTLVAEFKALLKLHPEISTIVVAASWNSYFLEADEVTPGLVENKPEYYVEEQGHKYPLRTREFNAIYHRRLVGFLSGLAQERAVFLLLDNPHSPRFAREHLAGLNTGRLNLLLHGTAAQQQRLQQPFALPASGVRISAALRENAQKAGVHVIDPVPLICPQQRCSPVMPDGRPKYKDAGHLRPFFVQTLDGLFDPVYQAARR